LRIGNCSTAEIETLMKTSKAAIDAFEASEETTMIMVRATR
jgi:predicted nuclease of predicted toxin-antitoxin system